MAEPRDPRFAELDALIAAGRGDERPELARKPDLNVGDQKPVQPILPHKIRPNAERRRIYLRWPDLQFNLLDTQRQIEKRFPKK